MDVANTAVPVKVKRNFKVYTGRFKKLQLGGHIYQYILLYLLNYIQHAWWSILYIDTELEKIFVSENFFEVNDYFCSSSTATSNKLGDGILVMVVPDVEYQYLNQYAKFK